MSGVKQSFINMHQFQRFDEDSNSDSESQFAHQSQTLYNPSAHRDTLAQPPSLNYSLHDRKKSIAITWTVIFTQAGICPILLYYVLHHFTTLETKLIITIISLITLLSLVDFFIRCWKIWQPDDQYRPDGAGRWGLDIFHVEFSVGVVFITALFAAGISSGPNLHIVALPIPVLVTEVATQLLLTSWLASRGTCAPFRISSMPAGSPIRPALYYIVEDVVAINGGGGKAYRRALNQRYMASAVFRQMIAELNVAWGLAGAVVGIATIIINAKINVQISYGLSWGIPWAFAGVASWLTIMWIKKRLADERRSYGQMHV